MRPKPKRLPTNQFIGKEVLKKVQTYRFDNKNSEEIPVTAARRYVKQNNIVGPAIIEVIRTEFTTDRFYWCKNGMFSATFAEVNYVNFEELRTISNELTVKGIISNQREAYWGMEVREPNYEFMYA